MIHLQIYVQVACATCTRSRKLATEIAKEYNQVRVEIIEIESLSADNWPSAVFATPTWLMNGRRYCLGTPDGQRLRQEIAAYLSDSSSALPKGHL